MEKVLEKTDVLPKGWKVVQLGEIASKIQYGFTESSSDKEVGPKFLRITDIQNNSVDWDAVPYCRISSAKLPEYLLQKGDLLFARTGATVGKSFLIRGSIPEAVFASYLIRVRLRKSMIDEVYLSYFFHSLFYWKQITEGQAGIGQPNVNGTKLKRLVIPLAPLPQQRRIVEAIELQLGRLDAAVAGLVAAKAKLKRYKQAVLKAAVGNTGFDTVDEDLGSMSELITSGSRGWAEYYAETGDTFIRAQNLKHDTLDLSDIAYVQLPGKVDGLRTQVQENDILITITGANVTKTALVTEVPEGRAFVNQHIALVRLKDPSQAPFVYRWIISPAHGRGVLEKLAYGAGKPGLNLTHIRDLQIPLPSPKEQAVAVAQLDAIDAANAEMETTLDAQLAQSTRLRQAVLKRAFEGRLVRESKFHLP